jgi:hypothetical protein
MPIVWITIFATEPKEAQTTIAPLRKLPGLAEDPRVELTEAAADEALGDFKREYTAAAQAAASANDIGARLLMANAAKRGVAPRCRGRRTL